MAGRRLLTCSNLWPGQAIMNFLDWSSATSFKDILTSLGIIQGSFAETTRHFFHAEECFFDCFSGLHFSLTSIKDENDKEISSESIALLVKFSPLTTGEAVLRYYHGDNLTKTYRGGGNHSHHHSKKKWCVNRSWPFKELQNYWWVPSGKSVCKLEKDSSDCENTGKNLVLPLLCSTRLGGWRWWLLISNR